MLGEHPHHVKVRRMGGAGAPAEDLGFPEAVAPSPPVLGVHQGVQAMKSVQEVPVEKAGDSLSGQGHPGQSVATMPDVAMIVRLLSSPWSC